MLPVALCQFRFPIVGRAATKTRLPGRQAWMMMKLTLILLTAFCVQLSAKGFSQGITISEKEASLEKVINEISRQSGYNIFYTESILQQAKKITIDVTNVSLTEALDLCFKDQPLTYTITGKTIIIKQKPEPKKKDEQPTVIPPIDIKGKIVNEKGQPIAGASVAVKGTDKGTSTDENGEFILTAVDPNATLLISGVNIESFEWKLKGRSNLGDISAITKIVVGEGVSVKANTGYEAVDPTRRPGSYVVIGNDLLNRTVSTDILSRLNGNAPGLLFNGGSASLGYLNIRSRSTIFGKTSPLIVVDNFPYYGDILSINPNDVESITILKDAAAGSIWGMMASNGVIVITTKTGRYNQPIQVSINSNVTISEKMDFFSSPQMSTEDFIEVEKFLFNKGYYDAAINSSSRPALTPVVEVLLKKRNGQLSDAVATSQIENLKSLDLRYDKNKYFFQRPVSQQYSVNLSGGSVNQRYYLSVGWDKNLRPKTGNEFTRLSINANNSYKLIKDRLEITSGIIYNQNNSEINSAGVPVGYPYARLADEFGNSLPIARYRQGYIDTAGAGKLLDWNYYPLEELNLSDHTIKGTGYQINTAAKYNIIEGLDVALTFQYRKEILEDRDLKNLETFFTRDYINSFSSINWANGTVTRPVPLGGILDVISSQSTFKNFRSQINYSHSWPNQHDVTALIGGEISEAITN
ncbi:MAG TPA: carboxypeptidase-like regulatory domain-containing protein, partial [Chitinophagaceae bacterium]|nr:carboxypeptidase-like regulatory domain-containing protein [Chitinophagaceae bacterium]